MRDQATAEQKLEVSSQSSGVRNPQERSHETDWLQLLVMLEQLHLKRDCPVSRLFLVFDASKVIGVSPAVSAMLYYELGRQKERWRLLPQNGVMLIPFSAR